jgi:hypothetical protein
MFKSFEPKPEIQKSRLNAFSQNVLFAVRALTAMQDEVAKVTVVFAILQALDSRPFDSGSLRNAVADAAGAHNAELWFSEALAGLLANEYVAELHGVWVATGKGRP